MDRPLSLVHGGKHDTPAVGRPGGMRIVVALACVPCRLQRQQQSFRFAPGIYEADGWAGCNVEFRESLEDDALSIRRPGGVEIPEPFSGGELSRVASLGLHHI